MAKFLPNSISPTSHGQLDSKYFAKVALTRLLTENILSHSLPMTGIDYHDLLANYIADSPVAHCQKISFFIGSILLVMTDHTLLL